MSLETQDELPRPTLHQLPCELPRANVLGVGVHAINMSQAVELFHKALQNRHKGYVCVTGVHGVMEAQRDPEFKSILQKAFLVTPDGMPTVWVGRTQGFSSMQRVFGPDLMWTFARGSVTPGWKHFLLGGKPGVALKLCQNMKAKFPGIQVVGTYAPPFGPLNKEQEEELIGQVARCKPDVIWVGLSTPKQERFMAKYLDKLGTTLMVGVGAAFDLHTGNIKDAPTWVKSAGLQWLHRLCQDPKRLWKRYLVNNISFVFSLGMQFLRLRNFSS